GEWKISGRFGRRGESGSRSAEYVQPKLRVETPASRCEFPPASRYRAGDLQRQDRLEICNVGSTANAPRRNLQRRISHKSAASAMASDRPQARRVEICNVGSATKK